MKKYIPFLLFVIVAVIFMYNRSSPKDEGNPAPNFEAELKDGSPFSLEDLKGKYVLLDFWGSWCPPCRRDNPNLVALYNQYNEKQFNDASGFELVSIAIEKNEKTWARAIEKDGLIWPYHILRTSRLVATDGLAIKYGVKDLPTKFLIGPQGDILGVNMSKQEIDLFLKSKL